MPPPGLLSGSDDNKFLCVYIDHVFAVGHIGFDLTEFK